MPTDPSREESAAEALRLLEPVGAYEGDHIDTFQMAMVNAARAQVHATLASLVRPGFLLISEDHYKTLREEQTELAALRAAGTDTPEWDSMQAEIERLTQQALQLKAALTRLVGEVMYLSDDGDPPPKPRGFA